MGRCMRCGEAVWRRSGKESTGFFFCVVLRSGDPRDLNGLTHSFPTRRSSDLVVIIAEDVSDNTRKRFQNMCDYHSAPIFFYGTKDELGHAIGKEYRASMAIVDQGLAKVIIQNINQEVADIWQK